MLTIQNPDPCMDLAEYIAQQVETSEINKIVWSYEMGAQELGRGNAAYDEELHERGELQGGNLHYQICFTTKKQFREAAMIARFPEDWVQGAYAPRAAENYCAKGDNTLVDGPWTWGHSKQGERNDLKEVHAKVMAGETYETLLRRGENLSVLAKYPRFVRQIQMMAGEGEVKEQWPLMFAGHTMIAPDPATKQRHWWIVGPPDWGKTYKMTQAQENRPVYYTKGSNKNKMEGYADQNLLIFDDCVMCFEELRMYTDTHKYGLKIPQRNVDGWLGRGKSRNVIVISNKWISECEFKNEAGVRARFIEIDITATKGLND
nr:MAG: replication associated protein [Cressdnaviricota sp.]